MTHSPQPEKSGQPPGLWRVLDDDDRLTRLPAGLKKDDLLAMFRTMLQVRTIDERMITLQRQGRITFYGAATGQEAAVIGSGYALEAEDWVVPALREGGVALLRAERRWEPHLADAFRGRGEREQRCGGLCSEGVDQGGGAGELAAFVCHGSGRTDAQRCHKRSRAALSYFTRRFYAFSSSSSLFCPFFELPVYALVCYT